LRNRKTALSSTYTSTVAPDKIPSTATIEKKSSFLKLPAAVYEPAAATAVGLVTAYTVVASKNLINAIDKASISKFALAPLLGTAFVALAYKFEPNLGTGQGVIPSTQSTTLPNLRLRFMRWLCVVIGLGTGSGMAFTSPSAEMGMVFGRMISRFVDFISKDELSQETKNNLCLAGSAAGVAANFQTPLTGAFFALEVREHHSGMCCVFCISTL
jgi:H+/Cl- antiporter ClcA